MNDLRAIEHAETAIHQSDPARRLRLVERALSADRTCVPALAVAALSFPDLRDAARAMEGVAEAGSPGYPGDATPALRAAVEIARAARSLALANPSHALHRLLSTPFDGLPRALLLARARVGMAAAGALGDVAGLRRHLAHAAALGKGLDRESAWLTWTASESLGEGDRDALYRAARATVPSLRDVVSGRVPAPWPGNVGYASGDAPDAVVMSAVMPALFRMGSMPA